MKFKDYICPKCSEEGYVHDPVDGIRREYVPEEYMFGDTEQMPEVIEGECPYCGGNLYRSVIGGSFHIPPGFEAVPRSKHGKDS